MMINGVNDMNRNLSVNVAGVDTQDISSARLKAMKRSGQVECETCANREYKDGSDEVNVSFKSAAHIDPSAAATKVMAHEQEHVSNANRKAASKDGEVLNATVTLKMAVCPECGRSYVVSPIQQLNILPHLTDRTRNQQIILNLRVKMWIMQDN